MKIEKIPVGDIKPNELNPRTIDEDAFNKLKANMEKFPTFLDIRPVVVDKDGVIVGGNMRHRAAKALGWKEVPVVIADNLTEEERKAFVILDNSQSGKWDADLLEEQYELEELEELGLDGEALDFSQPFNPTDEAESVESIEVENIQFTIVFENEAQQKSWFAFMKHIREAQPAETLAESLTIYWEADPHNDFTG